MSWCHLTIYFEVNIRYYRFCSKLHSMCLGTAMQENQEKNVIDTSITEILKGMAEIDHYISTIQLF